MAVDPRGADVKRFLSEDPGGPVVMLNLLRFADGGRERYAEYARAVAPFLRKVGGDVVYAGDGAAPLVAEAGQAWDAVLVVRYPSRAAFAAMVADPEYQRITPNHRPYVCGQIPAAIPQQGLPGRRAASCDLLRLNHHRGHGCVQDAHLVHAQRRRARRHDPPFRPGLPALGPIDHEVAGPGGSRGVVRFQIHRDDAVRDRVRLFPPINRAPILGGHVRSGHRDAAGE